MSSARLQEIFVSALGVSPSTDFSKLSYGEDEHWDSVAHMQLCAAIETAYDIMLETDDVIAMSSFSKAGEILKRYGVSV